MDDGAPLTWHDKVKVVRSRTHVNSLQTAVKEKEHIVEGRRFVSRSMTHF